MHNDLPFSSHITITVFIYAKQHLIKKKKETHHHWPNPSLEYNAQALGTPRVEPAPDWSHLGLLGLLGVPQTGSGSTLASFPEFAVLLPKSAVGDDRKLWDQEMSPLVAPPFQGAFSLGMLALLKPLLIAVSPVCTMILLTTSLCLPLFLIRTKTPEQECVYFLGPNPVLDIYSPPLTICRMPDRIFDFIITNSMIVSLPKRFPPFSREVLPFLVP